VEGSLRNFLGHKFRARGYFASTVGQDEEDDPRLGQMQLKLALS
jgi:hypothetical protein